MTDLTAMTDALHRLVKIALDTGEASSVEEAERIFAQYRVQIVVGPDVAHSPVLQAALLTAVNSGARAFLGGVTVFGAAGPLRVALPPYRDLQTAIAGLGAQVSGALHPDVPTIVIGDAQAQHLEPLAIRVTFAHWSGGIVPVRSGIRLAETGAFTPAGVLAGALAISEVFQRLRGGAPMACRRSAGLNLWDLQQAWLRGAAVVDPDRLPASAWLVGLGNLGQAYLWTLGLLPYVGEAAELVLQDTDILARSNLSTSLLTTPALLTHRKTRAMAAWAETRGFKTTIVERTFGTNFRVDGGEPSVALIGVDNALARQPLEEVGFTRIIEAGLGRGLEDFLGIDLHTFPASRTARATWPEIGPSDPDIAKPAYRALLEATGDRCGMVRLAARSIGAPFVGAAASALVVSELVRLCIGGPANEVISCHLRDPEACFVSPSQASSPYNPGSIAIAA